MSLASPPLNTGEPEAQSSSSSSVPERQVVIPSHHSFSLTAYLPRERGKVRFYRGLPSNPALIAQTRKFKWKERGGTRQSLGADYPRRFGQDQLTEMCDHVLEEIVSSLDSDATSWTTIDVVSFGLDGQWTPTILWVGVPWEDLSRDYGIHIAQKRKNVLRKYDVNELDCEIREANRIHNTGALKLIKSGNILEETADLEVFSNATSGMLTLAESISCADSTLGFYAASSGKNFAVTARRVRSSLNEIENERTEPFGEKDHISQQRHVMTLPGNATLQRQRRPQVRIS